MATAFVNNSDFASQSAEAVATIRHARKGVVKAVAIAATVIVTGIVVLTVLSAAGHVPAWVQFTLIVVWLGFCILATTECYDASQQLRGLPAYQALQRERQRLGYYLGRLAATCRPGVALEWRSVDYAYKAWQARTAAGAPAGVRILVLHGTEIKRYQVCRFGAELVICQTYQFDSAADAAAAFERGIVDGHAAAEVFGEDDPHILRQLNTVFEQLTSQEVTQTPPPNGGEFPTHTV